MKPQPAPGVPPSAALVTVKVMYRVTAFARMSTEPTVVAAGVDEALAEALHLDQPVPGRVGGHRVVALREGRRGRVGAAGGVGDVDVDQLRAERAAEGRRQVRGLHPEGHGVGAAVVDLERSAGRRHRA